MIFAFTAAFAQTTKTLGKVDSLYSKILNENRKNFVYVPEQNNFSGSVKTKYPVVYLLDSENHFNTVAGMINELSESSTLPEMIVIGITNTDRTRDLTPVNC